MSHDLTANFTAGEWTTIDQTGDVHFTQGSRMAQGTFAHMDRTNNVLKLAGPVILTDGTMRTTAATVEFAGIK